MLCEVCGLCYVKSLICVLWGPQSVLCGVVVCVMCAVFGSLQPVLCEVLGLCYVMSFGCVMGGLRSVFGGVLNLCYVKSLVCVMWRV